MDRTTERILIESFQVTVAGRVGSMGISKAFYCHLYHRILACFLILSITASVKQYALSFKCVTTLTTKGGSKLMMMREAPSKVSDLSEEGIQLLDGILNDFADLLVNRKPAKNRRNRPLTGISDSFP